MGEKGVPEIIFPEPEWTWMHLDQNHYKPRVCEPRKGFCPCFLMFCVQSVVTLDIWKSVTWLWWDLWTLVKVFGLSEDLDQISSRYWLTELFFIRLVPGPEEDLDQHPLLRLWRKQSCELYQCYSPVAKRDFRFKGTVQHFRKYSCSLFQ